MDTYTLRVAGSTAAPPQPQIPPPLILLFLPSVTQNVATIDAEEAFTSTTLPKYGPARSHPLATGTYSCPSERVTELHTYSLGRLFAVILTGHSSATCPVARSNAYRLPFPPMA